MSEHHFGVGRGRPQNRVRIAAIAKRHGASFVVAELPGEGWRFWFTCPNAGHPFDRATRDAVFADLKSAGLLESNGAVRVGLR